MPGKISLPIHMLSPYDDLKEAKDALSKEYLAPRMAGEFRASSITSPSPADNLSGIGIGEKYVDGRPTGVLAVKFLVRIKYPEAQLSSGETLPKEIDGLPVDVEEVGTFRRVRTAPRKRTASVPNPRTKTRPAQPGSSIGFQSPLFRMAGTFGAVVTDGTEQYILSNNHVLANEDQLPAGAPIFQPGLLDGGNAATDQIAALTRAVQLQASGMNSVDAAIAQILDPKVVKRDVLFIGPPKGTEEAQIDMAVHKFGRTTSYTVGRVTSIHTDVTVQYEVGNITFHDQILIVGRSGSQFSAAGDSGSLILERGTNSAVGLLFAGSETHTIANHIGDVLQALNVSLA